MVEEKDRGELQEREAVGGSLNYPPASAPAGLPRKSPTLHGLRLTGEAPGPRPQAPAPGPGPGARGCPGGGRPSA